MLVSETFHTFTELSPKLLIHSCTYKSQVADEATVLCITEMLVVMDVNDHRGYVTSSDLSRM